MVNDYKKSLADLVGTVRKETLSDFQNAFHQKTSLTKLTLYGTVVGGLMSCLEKAEQDATATKEQVDAYKAKHETYAKLKDKIQQDRNALKAAEAPKSAKELIAKFDLAN
jgi:uncharacterized protein YaiL (DUF2058 family)